MNGAALSSLPCPPGADRTREQSPHPRPIRARGTHWLAQALEEVWENHFWDVPRITPVRIRFGARWKNRLGLIRWEPATATSLIALNALFRHQGVPEALCRVTIAHELVHYAHGFGSALPRRVADPHADDLIERELAARGLGPELIRANGWVDEHWEEFRAKASTRWAT